MLDKKNANFLKHSNKILRHSHKIVPNAQRKKLDLLSVYSPDSWRNSDVVITLAKECFSNY